MSLLDDDFRFVGITPEQHDNLADAVDQGRARLAGDGLGEGFPRVTFSSQADLDQLMKRQGVINLSHDIFRQAFVTDHDDGFQAMSFATKLSLLRIRQVGGLLRRGRRVFRHDDVRQGDKGRAMLARGKAGTAKAVAKSISRVIDGAIDEAANRSTSKVGSRQSNGS